MQQFHRHATSLDVTSVIRLESAREDVMKLKVSGSG